MAMEGSVASGNIPMDRQQSQAGLFELRFDKPITLSLFVIALLTTICVVYWPVLTYPFVQDDWGQLRSLAHAEAPRFLSDALSMKGKLFYRPFSLLYFLLYYKCFALNPLPFHIIGLTIHLFNSLLVAFISWRLTRHHLISGLSGLIYAVAVTVHLDPLLWLVGFYDLWASFFGFAAIALFLTKRKFLSAAAFGLGVLAKEPGAVLILILLLILLYAIRPTRNLPGTICRTLWPHGLILIAYSLARIGNAVSPFSLPDTEPYAMRLLGVHLFKNIFRFAWWGVEAITPFRGLQGGTARWILWATIFLVGFLCFLSRKFSRTSHFPSGWIAFLAGWAGIGILPALLMPNHFYKYYLTYSLLPLILLSLSGVCWLFSLIARSGSSSTSNLVGVSPESVFTSPSETPPFHGPATLAAPAFPSLLLGIFISLALADTLSAAWHFRVKDQAGVSDRYTMGTNHLIHRGHAAKLILNYLVHRHATIPKGSVFLLEGFDLESLGGDDGLRTYYGDDEIRVFRRSEVVVDPEGRYVEKREFYRHPDDLQPPKVPIERGKLFCLRVEDGNVKEEDPYQAGGR